MRPVLARAVKETGGFLVSNGGLLDRGLRSRGGNVCPKCNAIGVSTDQPSKSGCLSRRVNRAEHVMGHSATFNAAVLSLTGEVLCSDADKGQWRCAPGVSVFTVHVVFRATDRLTNTDDLSQAEQCCRDMICRASNKYRCLGVCASRIMLDILTFDHRQLPSDHRAARSRLGKGQTHDME
ncbi:hypothetical protein P153DRAFT_383694 [Dothidotthia symphoricarpi CBS 119687]|uniref:Uncharacterized protein n=1 Tax=Dothidotthia symphoricarpi CBS 119687 TaxID=1392245 RepID=A0A6A6AHZ2_9PLEO|nr:uncharacterized protein P153DRAFT_383694 [Dothidotthia symphoricarpi CBS 119687]KAF2131602.1 hypothetical protein P153DRAFT_383694 [Dothidotthia symphoricarpi CBS 119687]